ncbi:DUF6879 family protein [Nocardia heshunensis]
MQLLDSDGLNSLIRGSKTEAFHLELLDDYESPEGDAVFRNWLGGGPEDDFAWFQEWGDLIGEITARGVLVRRARVVTVPLSDYQHWMLEITQRNVDAGEQVRYLPRHLADSLHLTADDWWLLDDATVSFTTFDAAGHFLGGTVTTDPRIAAICREVRDYVWGLAVPYNDFREVDTQ